MKKVFEKYNKEELITLLKKNNTKKDIVERVNKLPNIIKKNNHQYLIDININKINGHYEYDINYYCEDIMEYLLSHKIFNDIEISLNIIECQLNRKRLLPIT